MADIKFSCPHCQQHIEAESGYAGLEISCPACKGAMVVPKPELQGTRAPAAAPAPVPVQSAPGQVCPSCGATLPRGAVLCTNCGYNSSTGRRMVAGRAAPLGKPGAPQWEPAWYQTAYPYVGVVVVLLAVFYLLGKQNPTMMVVFLRTAVCYTITAHIILAVYAFQEGIGTGFLVLCVPFYALYYVFQVSENETIKVLYGSAFLLSLSLRFL